MRIVNVRKYRCDFCKRSSTHKYVIKFHEDICCGNPARVCNLHEHIKPQQPMAILVACLSIEKGDWGMKELRELADNCPGCIQAAIIQAKLQDKEDWREYGPLDYKFNFREEMETHKTRTQPEGIAL